MKLIIFIILTSFIYTANSSDREVYDIVFDVTPYGCFAQDIYVQPLSRLTIDNTEYICMPIGRNYSGKLLFFFETYDDRDVSYLDLFDLFLD